MAHPEPLHRRLRKWEVLPLTGPMTLSKAQISVVPGSIEANEIVFPSGRTLMWLKYGMATPVDSTSPFARSAPEFTLGTILVLRSYEV
jgi:hypothetical protein